MWYKNIACRFLDQSQSTHVTDGWTDRQMERITTPKTALAQLRCTVKLSFSTLLLQFLELYEHVQLVQLKQITLLTIVILCLLSFCINFAVMRNTLTQYASLLKCRCYVPYTEIGQSSTLSSERDYQKCCQCLHFLLTGLCLIISLILGMESVFDGISDLWRNHTVLLFRAAMLLFLRFLTVYNAITYTFSSIWFLLLAACPVHLCELQIKFFKYEVK